MFETYALLWKIVRLPLMPTMIAVLLTSKVGFSAADSVTSLKLVEQGVPKDKLSMLAIPLIPLQGSKKSATIKEYYTTPQCFISAPF